MAKILLIDDNEAVRESLGEILKMENHEVHIAENGVNGMKVCKKNSFDIIISDLFMPDKDGFEVIREIKSESYKSKLIAISGFGNSNNTYLTMAKKMGADAIISKPINFSTFIDKINELLN